MCNLLCHIKTQNTHTKALMIILQRKSKKGQRKSTNEKTVKTFIIFVAIIKIYAQLKSIAKKEGKKKNERKS